LDQRLHIRMEGEVKLLLDLLRQAVLVRIMQLHIEGFESTQHSKSDTACAHTADTHAFEVIGALNTICDVPAALDDPTIGGDVVSDERQNQHHHMLSDTDRIGKGYLSNRDPLVHGCLKIGMVGTDAGGDDQLELLSFVDALLGHVGWPEGLRDDDLSVGQLFVEYRVLAILARGNNEGVTGLLKKFSQAEFTRNTAQ